MLKNKAFYHSHTRNILAVFGQIFNNITVNRINTAGELVQTIDVPIAYSVKQKFIQRIQDAPSLDDGRARFEIVLPRIGYEISSLVYDSDRKLTTTTTQRAINTTNGVQSAFVSTPYVLGIDLTVYAKNQDDGFQIVEQILPYFNPDFNIRINEIPELGVIRDIQIRLESISPSEDFESPLDKRTTVMWDLHFSVMMNYFGYVEKANLIKKTIISLFATPTDGPLNTNVGTKIITTPNPLNADPSGAFTYMQEFDNIQQA